jgi:hypothetical protein
LYYKTRGPVGAVLEQIRRDRIPDKLLLYAELRNEPNVPLVDNCPQGIWRPSHRPRERTTSADRRWPERPTAAGLGTAAGPADSVAIAVSHFSLAPILGT